MARAARTILKRVTGHPALAEEIGATTLEYGLLLAAIAIPSYWAIQLALDTLVGHYRLMTMLNALPFP